MPKNKSSKSTPTKRKSKSLAPESTKKNATSKNNSNKTTPTKRKSNESNKQVIKKLSTSNNESKKSTPTVEAEILHEKTKVCTQQITSIIQAVVAIFLKLLERISFQVAIEKYVMFAKNNMGILICTFNLFH